jgi:hypothetical protein
LGSISDKSVRKLLAVVRLGDADRLGWWRSHGVDEVGEYVLSHAFPTTWLLTGLELSLESARIRHDEALGRSSAVHLFSDQLPFHRLLRASLIERKLRREETGLADVREITEDELRAALGEALDGEPRSSGLFVGEVARESLEDPDEQRGILDRLAASYAGLRSEFRAPYLDLLG